MNSSLLEISSGKFANKWLSLVGIVLGAIPVKRVSIFVCWANLLLAFGFLVLRLPSTLSGANLLWHILHLLEILSRSLYLRYQIDQKFITYRLSKVIYKSIVSWFSKLADLLANRHFALSLGPVS